MADNEAMPGRIHDHDGDAKSLTTPSTMCRRLDMPKVDEKHGALRPPRAAKVVMPFMGEMTDEALAEMRKRLEAEAQSEDERPTAAAMTRTA